MPLKLNVGLAKKIGQPDYGSLGASCNVELELESSLIQNDPKTFQRHVRNAFVICRQAVNEELARQQSEESAVHRSAASANGQSSTSNGQSSGHSTNNNGHASHRASQKQLDFANQLAKAIRGLGVRRLESLAEKMFSKPLADLSTMDASGLIDTLKAIKEDRIRLEDALSGVEV